MTQPPMTQSKILSIRNLQVQFVTDLGVVQAVRGVDLSLHSGKILALVGESGSGKSVTALSILRLVPSPPAQVRGGGILFHGQNLLRMPERELRAVRGNKIAMIFQDPMTSLHPLLTVGKQLTETMQAHHVSQGAAATKRAAELLRLTGIPDPLAMLRRYPSQLSGGMQQRVMIAMALCCNPEVIIADEPTTALDVSVQMQILDILRRVRAEFGTAILFITHDLGVVAELADDVAVMYAGKIVSMSSAAHFFADPKHPYSEALLKALPEIDVPQDRLVPIQGAPPDLSAIPPGCSFAPRCPCRADVCVTTEPALRPVGRGYHVSCHFAKEDPQ
jgi:oligopeptide/dipeptide ABC transporter ATP-binding protein